MSAQLRCRCKLPVASSDSNAHCRCCKPSSGNWRIRNQTVTFFAHEDRDKFLNPWEEEQIMWTQANSLLDSSSTIPASLSSPSLNLSSSQHDNSLRVVSEILSQSFTSTDIIELIITFAEPPFSACVSHQEIIGSKYLSTLIGGKELQSHEESGDENGTMTELKFEHVPNNTSICAWSGLCSSLYRCDARFVLSTASTIPNSEPSIIQQAIAFDLNSDCSFFQSFPDDLKWDSSSSKVSGRVLSGYSAIDLHRLTIFYTIHRPRGFSQMLSAHRKDCKVASKPIH